MGQEGGDQRAGVLTKKKGKDRQKGLWGQKKTKWRRSHNIVRQKAE